MNNKIFDEAKKNFITVYTACKNNGITHTSNKFSYLPEWNLQQSKYFLNECFNPKKKYLKCARGSIVFVDFGINIGSELCNKHFAVVLNKNDTMYNRTLTVVPLSSKNGKYSVEIPDLIIGNVIDSLSRIVKSQSDEIFKMQYKMISHGVSVDELFDGDTKYKSKYREWVQKQPEEELKLYKESGNITNEQIIKFSYEIQKFEKLLSHYQRFDKTTYVKCGNIQTISKDRIIKLNSLDPVGKFRISQNSLDIIDKELLSLFIKN